ncbi:MAG: hypothetical protein Q8P26_02955 [Candidatus Levybacteria bacterium]|nr:hypothetical protein [Candidatus Levybacteria bacterium]
MSNETYRNEHRNRLLHVTMQAGTDGLNPEEYMKRVIRGATYPNSSIKDGDPFVVLGHDGFNRTWFPVSSFKTREEALLHLQKAQDGEHLYSDGGGASSTFFAFTRDGNRLGI